MNITTNVRRTKITAELIYCLLFTVPNTAFISLFLKKGVDLIEIWIAHH